MKTKARIIISTISLIITIQIPAQDTIDYKTVFPSGISVGYGQGLYSVKDEYISKEKYSGTLPYFNIEWVRFHNKNGYRLEFEYRKSTNITNNNMSAEAQQLHLIRILFILLVIFRCFLKMFMLIWGLRYRYFIMRSITILLLQGLLLLRKHMALFFL